MESRGLECRPNGVRQPEIWQANRLSIIPTILCLFFVCEPRWFIYSWFRLAELSQHFFFPRRSPPEKINNGNGKQDKHVNGSWWDFFSPLRSSFFASVLLGMTPRASPFGHGFGSQLLWAAAEVSSRANDLWNFYSSEDLFLIHANFVQFWAT